MGVMEILRLRLRMTTEACSLMVVLRFTRGCKKQTVPGFGTVC